MGAHYGPRESQVEELNTSPSTTRHHKTALSHPPSYPQKQGHVGIACEMKLLTLPLLVSCAGVLATLRPCLSNTKGACPGAPACSAAKTSTDIQAAECSHNTRTHATQTFAVFTTDHSKDTHHGAPYGTCEAYTCAAPNVTQMTTNTDCWTFFWRSEFLPCRKLIILESANVPVTAAREHQIAPALAVSGILTMEHVDARTPTAHGSKVAPAANE